MTNSLAILTEFVCILLEGGSVFLFTKKKLADIGDIIPLKETFRYTDGPFRGDIECQADCWRSGEEQLHQDWMYANAMPVEYSKRSVIVADTAEMTSDEIAELYGDIIVYNRRFWSAPFVLKDDEIWFRPNLIQEIPEGTYVKHELRLVGYKYQ